MGSAHIPMGFGPIDLTDLSSLWFTLAVTVLYLSLYYANMFHLAFRRIGMVRAGIDRDEIAKHPKIIAADRTFLNMLEQMPPFLASMWLFSIFCHPYWGGALGLIYTTLRAFYFFVYPPPKAFIVTLPNYLIIFVMLACTFVEAMILAF